MRQHPKRRYLWLFAALLPVELYATPAEHAPKQPYAAISVAPKDNYVDDFAWSLNSQRIAVDRGADFVLIDAVKSRILKTIPKRPIGQKKMSFHFSPDGKSLLVENWNIQLSTGTIRKRAKPSKPDSYPAHVSFMAPHSPDGKVRVVIGNGESYYDDGNGGPAARWSTVESINLCDNRTGKVLFRLLKKPYIGVGPAYQFSEDSNYVFMLGEQNSRHMFQVWRVKDGKQLLSFPCSGFSFDVCWKERLFCTWDWEGNIHCWNISTKKETWTAKNSEYISTARLSPDGRTLAVGSAKGTLTLYRVK